MEGCPIRISADHKIFAPPRSLTQLITSFFASESQGIHRTPLFAFVSFRLFRVEKLLNYLLIKPHSICQRTLIVVSDNLKLIDTRIYVSIKEQSICGGERSRTDDPPDVKSGCSRRFFPFMTFRSQIQPSNIFRAEALRTINLWR